MVPTRRQLLAALGGGASICLLAQPSTADNTERVFVHPRTGLVGDVLDAVDAIGGTIIFEYDNFPFVAAEIPADRRGELLSAVGIDFIEDDDDLGIPSDWTPSLPDLLDPGDDGDCSTHPDQRPPWGGERIGAGDIDGSGADVDVGILDTGIQPDHCTLSVADGADFTNTVSPGDWEDGHGHGTHVAGIVGASDNDIGVIGVAPSANLHAVKVLDDNGDGRHSAVVAGIDWCMSNDIEVISMSLGGNSSSAALDEAITDAHDTGHLLICSAGNNDNNGDGTCEEETMTYPATHPDVLAVVAMNEDETIAGYSSVGTAINLLAPGTDIESTYVNNGYAAASGTSIACPFVTGVATVAWEHHGEAGPGANDAVASTLADTAEPVLGTCEEGDGLVDAPAAVAAIGNGRDEGGADTDPDDPDDSRLDIGSDAVMERLEDVPWWIAPGAVAGGAIGYSVKRYRDGTE